MVNHVLSNRNRIMIGIASIEIFFVCLIEILVILEILEELVMYCLERQK